MSRKNGPQKWEVRGGVLYIDGANTQSAANWTMSMLERSLSQLKEGIVQSGHAIIIEAIYIEKYVAESLFAEGTLTETMLSNAEIFDGITFMARLGGDLTQVSIQNTTHSGSFDFIISGHPTGKVRVQAGEKI